MAEEEKIEIPAKFADLVKKIEEMSAIDLAELVKILEKKFGVSAAAPVAAAPVAAAEEKSSFDVLLTGPGDKKIEVIKVVKEVTQKGLKEAKDLVEASASAPQMILEGAKQEEANELKKKLEAAGAKVELK